MKTKIKDFENIYHQTYEKLRNHIIINTNSKNDVNDILQETYLELYKKINKKQVESKFILSYLMKIADYKIKKQQTKNSKKLKIFNSLKEKITIFQKETQELNTSIFVKEILNDLNKEPLVFKIFHLYFYEEYTIKEIAKKINISESNVKNLLYRNIKKLKEKYKEDLDE